MKRTLMFFLAAIGAFTLLAVATVSAGILLLRSTGGDLDLLGGAVHSIDVRSEVVAPDDASRAVLLTDMAGGAAGSCKQYVALVPDLKDATWWNSERVRELAVFEVSCASDVRMKWLSARTLAISYSVPMEGVQTWMRRQDKSKKITVGYELRPV